MASENLDQITVLTNLVQSSIDRALLNTAGGVVEVGIEKMIEQVIKQKNNIDLATEDSVGLVIEGIDNIDEDAGKALKKAVKAISLKTMNIIQDTLETSVQNCFPLIKTLKSLKIIRDQPSDETETEPDYSKIFEDIKGFREHNFIAFLVENNDKIFDAAVVREDELKQLLADPNVGEAASKLLSELIAKYDESLIAGNIDANPDCQLMSTPSYKWIIALSGSVKNFGGEEVHNVVGSSKDRRVSSWKRFWRETLSKHGMSDQEKCYIDRPGRHSSYIVGGHLQKVSFDRYWYILPICNRHNSQIYNPGRTIMITMSSSHAVQIATVPLSQEALLTKFNQLSISNKGIVTETQNTMKELASTATKIILPTILKSLFNYIQVGIKEAGEETKILIRNAGVAQGPSLMLQMKETCLNHFHSVAAKKINAVVSNFQWDEAAVLEAADKVITSQKWKTALANLGKT